MVFYLGVQDLPKQKCVFAAMTIKNLHSSADCCISSSTIQRKIKTTGLLPIFNTQKLKQTGAEKETTGKLRQWLHPPVLPSTKQKRPFYFSLLCVINVRMVRQLGMRWCWS